MRFSPRILVLSLAISIAAAGARATERLPSVHIVFDLDWTLLSSLPAGGDYSAFAHDPRFFVSEGTAYMITDGVGETIRRLLDFNRRLGYPYVKISFFSGGTRERNLEALRRIVVDEKAGLSAAEIAEKVLSFADLKNRHPEIPLDRRLPFAERWAKDIETPFQDLERTVAVDDTAEFYVGEQRKNLLWLDETYDYYLHYADVEAARARDAGAKYLPPSREAWLYDRNRISIVGLELEYALDAEIAAAKAGRARKTPFRDRVAKVRKNLAKAKAFAALLAHDPARVFRDCGSLFSR